MHHSTCGSPVIWTLECSSGQVSNPALDYRVSVMPGLHWTHVWNRSGEDTVTYQGLKLSSGSCLTLWWGKIKRINKFKNTTEFIWHSSDVWLLSRLKILKLNLATLGIHFFLYTLHDEKKNNYMGKYELEDSYINYLAALRVDIQYNLNETIARST